MQPCVIKFFSGLLQVGRFHRILRLPSPNKTDTQDIAEIFLIMALNTIQIIKQDKKTSNVTEKRGKIQIKLSTQTNK
jgi:hypothetical protein